jgi:hypothetical protein
MRAVRAFLSALQSCFTRFPGPALLLGTPGHAWARLARCASGGATVRVLCSQCAMRCGGRASPSGAQRQAGCEAGGPNCPVTAGTAGTALLGDARISKTSGLQCTVGNFLQSCCCKGAIPRESDATRDAPRIHLPAQRTWQRADSRPEDRRGPPDCRGAAPCSPWRWLPRSNGRQRSRKLGGASSKAGVTERAQC